MVRWVAAGIVAGLLPLSLAAQTVSQQTRDAMVHVLAHEIGHALLREFDLPILGPEEDIADDFATVYVHMMLPDRAADIVAARARQNMADGADAEMFSEYRSDDQRAGRSICVLYGLDPDRHAGLATAFGLEGDAADTCRDMAPEVGRSWRRIIAAHRMPDGARVTEVGLSVEEGARVEGLLDERMRDTALALLAGIDWHSRITLRLAQCDGSSFWARNGRQITICDGYVARFEEQLGG